MRKKKLKLGHAQVTNSTVLLWGESWQQGCWMTVKPLSSDTHKQKIVSAIIYYWALILDY